MFPTSGYSHAGWVDDWLLILASLRPASKYQFSLQKQQVDNRNNISTTIKPNSTNNNSDCNNDDNNINNNNNNNNTNNNTNNDPPRDYGQFS